ncbi:MAG: hypothetical protein ACLGXA_08055 [Acidobacteriota bacterium]
MKLIAVVLIASSLFAQVPTLPSTYLAKPLNALATNGTPTQVTLIDPSIVGSSYLTIDQATGNPAGSNGAFLYMNTEAMKVFAVNNGIVQVNRGASGTRTATEGALSKVWVASARYFWLRNPSGVCNPGVQTVTPAVVFPSGQAYECQGDGTWGASNFSWSAAQFKWNAANQGVWGQIAIEQGDWNVASINWNQSFSWSQFAQ